MLLFRTPRLTLSASENLASLLLPVCSFFKGSGSRGPMNVGRHVTLSGSGFRFSPINVGLVCFLFLLFWYVSHALQFSIAIISPS
ncbi:hypothetical protein F2Q70_00044473 [Brassica cretica]|uniref:Uncharacterized protein n=1 Tax=Brassica cretica TaxID=69181 RepID=A0A8S9KJ36_BRACR|nr:hypothetical protein F2Q70_00044473 [Brassica cretica]